MRCEAMGKGQNEEQGQEQDAGKAMAMAWSK